MKRYLYREDLSMNAKEFLQSIYGNDVKEVFYQVATGYPYKAIPIEEAIIKVEADIEEMREFFSEYFTGEELDDKAKRAAFDIWENHLLVTE